MEDYKDALEDLLGEAEITIRDAYQRGIEKGGRTNKAILESRKNMLNSFELYSRKYYRRAMIYDSVFFVDESKSVALTLDELIKNFLLTYDDAED